MEKKKKTIKITKLIQEDRKQLSHAVGVGLDQIFETKEVKQFYQTAKSNIKKNPKPNHIQHEIIPFRYTGMFLPESSEKRTYFIDSGPEVNISHYDIYRDVIEWFWQNSDYAFDYTDENPLYELNETTKKILCKTVTKGGDFYNISKFGTKNGGTEFLDHEGYEVLSLNDDRIKKLRSWLITKDWPEYAVVSPDECPCFLRSINEKGIDRIIILSSLLSWNLFSKRQQDSLINKFTKDGFKYFNKAGDVLVDKSRIRDEIHFGHFDEFKFPLERE